VAERSGEGLKSFFREKIMKPFVFERGESVLFWEVCMGRGVSLSGQGTAFDHLLGAFLPEMMGGVFLPEEIFFSAPFSHWVGGRT